MSKAMTREKMLEVEDKLYEAIRDKWGYGDEGDEIVDATMEAIEAWLDREEGAELKISK